MYPRSLSESGLDWSGLVKRANMLKLAAAPPLKKETPKPKTKAEASPSVNNDAANQQAVDESSAFIPDTNPPLTPAEKAFRNASQGTTTKAGPPLDNDAANQQAVDESAPYFKEDKPFMGPVDDRLHGPMPATLLDRAYQHRVPLGLAALLVGGGGAGLGYYLNKRRKKRPPMGM